MARLPVSDEKSMQQIVEELLCQALNVPYKRETRKCKFRFELPTGKVVEKEDAEREVLPAPVQEIMEGFLEQALSQQFDDGLKSGQNVGHMKGYKAGYEDGKNGAEPQYDVDEENAMPEDYKGGEPPIKGLDRS